MSQRGGSEDHLRCPGAGLAIVVRCRLGGLIVVSGTVGRDAETGQTGCDSAGLTKQLFQKMDDQLTIAGTSLDSSLNTTVFLVDVDLCGR